MEHHLFMVIGNITLCNMTGNLKEPLRVTGIMTDDRLSSVYGSVKYICGLSNVHVVYHTCTCGLSYVCV